MSETLVLTKGQRVGTAITKLIVSSCQTMGAQTMEERKMKEEETTDIALDLCQILDEVLPK
jgi:hypothetical protein